MSLDDIAIGRPPRHGRAGKRSVPLPTQTPDSATENRPCVGCGAAVAIPLPESFPPQLRALAKISTSQLHGAIPVRCATCVATEAAEEDRADRERARAEAIERRRRVADLPPKWAGMTFDTVDRFGDRGPAVELAARWGRGEWGTPPVRGLFLHGQVGTGKTTLAAAAANLRLQTSAVRWLPVAELLMDLATPFDSKQRERAMRRLDAGRGRSALVLDDLDKVKPTEHAVQPLYVAINAWIEAELPLLVTCNRDLDKLADWLPHTFADPIASRLAGYCRIRPVTGNDRRLERA